MGPRGFSIAEAASMRARLLGLAALRELPPRWALHIPRCRAVHTFGMRFALDLIFVAPSGDPVRVARDVKPGRLVFCARASSVIELSAGQAERYLQSQSERRQPMFISVLVRRLREGKTYDDFVEAWYPDKGFGFDGRGPMLARSLEDEREILTFGFVDLPNREELGTAMERVAQQESVRHDRIDDVIESTTVRGIYELVDEFDFSTDESVARGRP
jgi:uncharacterized membrane protein (UPF0127 family)